MTREEKLESLTKKFIKRRMICMKDNVNHPSHYETGKFECIEVMLETQGKEAVKDFCICNAFKYIYRHNNKNGVEDIKKAKWYLDKYIEIDESEECKDPIKDRWEFINKNFRNSIERYGIDIEYGAGPSVIFVATKLEDKPRTEIDINLPDVDFYRLFTRFLCGCAIKDRKKEDWVDYNVKVGRAMENAIKEETHKVTKEKLIVSDKVLDDLVKGARKCCEDICNGTIHADNETGYDKGVDLNQRKKRIVSFEVVNKCSANISRLKEMYGIGMRGRNISVTYWPNFDIYLMTCLPGGNNLAEHQMVKGDVDYETLSVELLRFFEYIDMAYGDDEKEENEDE